MCGILHCSKAKKRNLQAEKLHLIQSGAIRGTGQNSEVW